MVTATAEDGDHALVHALALHPDVILLDTGVPDGLGIVTKLAGAIPDVPIIALGVAETEHAVLTWAEAGIAGYVHRSASIVELIDTATLAIRGEQACSTRIAGAMLRRLHQLAETARQDLSTATHASLTPREREIAQLVAEGLSNKVIAHRLHIEVATTKSHVHNLLNKLKFHRRSDVARWVRQQPPAPDLKASVFGGTMPAGGGGIAKDTPGIVPPISPMDLGFPKQNATKHSLLDRFPIQPKRRAV